jgi:hypothetical protein
MTDTEGSGSPHRGSRFALPLILGGGIAIPVAALLLIDCTPLPNGASCDSFTNSTCLASGICPYAPTGVVLLLVAFIALAIGIALYVGRRPEGEGPHPEEERERKAVQETAMMRMEREREEARERRRREDE